MLPVTDDSKKSHPWHRRIQENAIDPNLVFLPPQSHPKLVARFHSRLCRNKTLCGGQCFRSRMTRRRRHPWHRRIQENAIDPNLVFLTPQSHPKLVAHSRSRLRLEYAKPSQA